MNKDELLKIIKENNNKNIFAIVGPNSSGKTFTLDYIYDSISENSMYFNETGTMETKVEHSRIKIQNKMYIYTDETKVGEINETSFTKTIEISDNSLDLINFSKEKLSLLNKASSLGTKKLTEILNSFQQYNLNEVNYILMDEPENFLDDNNLNIIRKLFDAIVLSNRKIIFVTHSPRLLELLKIEIDSIFIMNPNEYNSINHISKNKVSEIYEESASLCRNIKKSSDNPSYNKTVQFDAPPIFKDLYLSKLLTSQEFYRSLFYKKIYLMEGPTEKFMLDEAKDSVPYTENVFFTDGKYKAPFLLMLFANVCNEVICIIDSDKDENDSKKHSYLFNSVFDTLEKQFENISIKFLNKNIENELEIDPIKTLASILGKNKVKMENFYKPYIVLYSIRNNPKLVNKINEIFKVKEKWEF